MFARKMELLQQKMLGMYTFQLPYGERLINTNSHLEETPLFDIDVPDEYPSFVSLHIKTKKEKKQQQLQARFSV